MARSGLRAKPGLGCEPRPVLRTAPPEDLVPLRLEKRRRTEESRRRPGAKSFSGRVRRKPTKRPCDIRGSLEQVSVNGKAAGKAWTPNSLARGVEDRCRSEYGGVLGPRSAALEEDLLEHHDRRARPSRLGVILPWRRGSPLRSERVTLRVMRTSIFGL